MSSERRRKSKSSTFRTVWLRSQTLLHTKFKSSRVSYRRRLPVNLEECWRIDEGPLQIPLGLFLSFEIAGSARKTQLVFAQTYSELCQRIGAAFRISLDPSQQLLVFYLAVIRRVLLVRLLILQKPSFGDRHYMVEITLCHIWSVLNRLHSFWYTCNVWFHLVHDSAVIRTF